MEDLTAAPSAEPAYLSRLALQSIPFGVSLPVNGFYKSPIIEQRLNLVLHLVRASDKISLIQAPEGHGKSVFLDELEHRFGEDIRCCRIKGSRSLNLQTFSTAALNALGVDSRTPDVLADPQHSLKQHLTRIRQLGITSVLMVDDIEQLAEPVMQVLTVWLGWQHEGQYLLQAVMACQERVKFSDRLQERLQALDLPLLAQDELPDYLMCRLQASGYSGELPFNQQQLKRFYRLSSGHPTKLNQLAHQQLLGHGKAMSLRLPQLPRLPGLNFKLPFNSRWLWSIPVLVALAGLLANQQKINSWLQQGMSDEPMAEVEIISGDDLQTVIVDEPELPQADVLERDTFLQLLSELDEQVDSPAANAESAEFDLIDELPEVVAAESESELEAAVVEPAELSMADATEADVEPATAVTTPVRASDKIHQQDWIMRQRGTSYTFQLMGSWELDEVDAFVEKYELKGDVAVFASIRNERTWYALIYGVYPGRQQAMTANTNWPAPLNTVPTWLRRIDSVQEQIKTRGPQS
ncbi:MAG: hypothetical protein JJU48_01060 [Methylophaga sp.]|nr:hypothetical protein [Methylophaga sp.]